MMYKAYFFDQEKLERHLQKETYDVIDDNAYMDLHVAHNYNAVSFICSIKDSRGNFLRADNFTADHPILGNIIKKKRIYFSLCRGTNFYKVNAIRERGDGILEFHLAGFTSYDYEELGLIQ